MTPTPSSYPILLTSGDGIGPEIVDATLCVLDRVATRFSLSFSFHEDHVGGAAIARYGVALRPETVERARGCKAVLFGAVGDPRYDDPRSQVRPEQAILGLRRGLGLYANLRPVRVDEVLADLSPLRPEIVRGVDVMVVRELTGGIYFGQPQRRFEDEAGRHAVDTMVYDEHEIRRIVELAVDLARGRRGRITSVDKANVLATSRLWREVATEVLASHADIRLEHMLVDACAMQLIRNPAAFDVIVTENMFGDILTDEAAMLGGSLGMMPSASIGARENDGTYFGLYEPIHGSAPDIAGQGIANPIGTILSAAMMLRYSLREDAAANAIEQAVRVTLAAGARTRDLVNSTTPTPEVLGTREMASRIAEHI